MSDAKAGLLVPLVFHGRVMGVLEAFDSLGDTLEFSAEDERIMEAFAASAATAVATAQDVAEQTLLRSIDASDRERARWARELHDETLQELSAFKITLSGAKRAADADAVRDGVGTALELSEHAIRGLREIISDLRPAALDALGTQAALETLVERIRTRSDIEVELSVDLSYESGRAATRHVPTLEAAIYRIAQEAIANTIKHAEATRVIVALVERGDVLTLSVEDDGRGFDQDNAAGQRALASSAFASASSCSAGRSRSPRIPAPAPGSMRPCPSHVAPARRRAQRQRNATRASSLV